MPFPNQSTFYDDHKKEIEDAVAKLDEQKANRGNMEVAIVEGKLAERRVVGAVFLRSQPEANAASIRAVVSRVAEIATPNPGSPAEVTCSLPALEHVIARLRVSEQRY